MLSSMTCSLSITSSSLQLTIIYLAPDTNFKVLTHRLILNISHPKIDALHLNANLLQTEIIVWKAFLSDTIFSVRVAYIQFSSICRYTICSNQKDGIVKN